MQKESVCVFACMRVPLAFSCLHVPAAYWLAARWAREHSHTCGAAQQTASASSSQARECTCTPAVALQPHAAAVVGCNLCRGQRRTAHGQRAPASGPEPEPARARLGACRGPCLPFGLGSVRWPHLVSHLRLTSNAERS
jgi:hypothetical protein